MTMIREATAADLDAWLALRLRLWPVTPIDEHRREVAQQLAEPARFVALLAFDDGGRAVGFAEAALRADPVNGCLTSPVAFLEGIYVLPAAQRRGIARALCAAIERWAVARGCTELGSDALLDNGASHGFHRAIGFAPTERVVFYRKELK
jgi:aminoglycoside 6'-N-acetyltransferase I